MELEVESDEWPTALSAAVHCSQGSGDNWTDLVTNVTSLEPQRFEGDFRTWLALGSAPPDVLSVFLHEATHHLCFSSPLGVALAGLALRARRRAVMLAERTDMELETLLLDDLVRFEITLTLLRPLAEGLAAFTEFDAFPKLRSRAVSSVMRWAGILYMDPTEVAADMTSLPAEAAIDVGLAQALARLRRDGKTVNRKSSVLIRPFAAAADGYHDGYDCFGMVCEARGNNRQAADYYRKVIAMARKDPSFYEDDFPEYYEKLIRRLDPASMGALPPNPRDI